MAKKETIELKAKTGSMYAYLRQGSVAPFIREERWTTDPWIWHGRKNLFPEYIRALVDNCGPLERCITMLAQFIAGTEYLIARLVEQSATGVNPVAVGVKHLVVIISHNVGRFLPLRFAHNQGAGQERLDRVAGHRENGLGQCFDPDFR